MALVDHLVRHAPALARLFGGDRLYMADDGVLQAVAQSAAKTPVRPRRPQPGPGPELRRALAIPCPDTTVEDRLRDAHQAHGQNLARQEAWQEVADALAAADMVRARTPGGLSIAELIAYGARADVVAAAEHALFCGEDRDEGPLLNGIGALEEVLIDRPDCPYTAAVVAHAHMDLGWAWRGTDPEPDVPERHMAAFSAHFDRAAEILDPFEAAGREILLIAGAIAALSAGQPSRAHRIARDHEVLIDLDPHASRAMRTLGTRLLPRWGGSYETLEVAARRIAARTEATWGTGGYAWVMFDAIATDASACARVDLEFFIEGLSDIARRTTDQHSINLLAAYCAVTMGERPASENPLADAHRASIARLAPHIIRDHLQEVHPMLWAHAARGFDNALRVRCPDRFAAAGYADALRVLTDYFRADLGLSGSQAV